MMPTPILQIHLLGGFRVIVEDTRVPTTSWQRRPAAIVKLLALEPSHRLHRERLMDMLWPDLDLDAQGNNLNVSLHAARRILTSAGAPTSVFLTRERGAVILGPSESLWVDIDAFEQAVAHAWRTSDPAAMRAALDLYTGDLLPDDPYEEWLEGRGIGLRTSYLALLTRLGQFYAEGGDTSNAIGVFGRLATTEPTQEAAHVALMRLYALAGQRAQALAQYEQLTATLDRELGVEPDAATQALAEAIRDGGYPDITTPLIPDELVEATPSLLTRSNLPAFVSEFVGREREIAEVRQLLSTSRLVTLTGPGGVGKTRLAIAAAEQLRDAFPDGVVFVQLQSLNDPALVLPTIAHTLGVREAGELSLPEVLGMALAERRLLLVLDNFEQLLPAAMALSELLSVAPTLTVLVTSRAVLGLYGEYDYPVEPLALPDGGPDLSTGELAQVEAIQLFVERAQAAQHGFRLTEKNVEDIAAICARLEGLPLALELAAARLRVLSPKALLEQMEHRLQLLTGGPRDAPARQQTMRNTIAWSYDLLPPAQQRFFRQLAVFTGGWTLEAAEAVCEAELDTLTILVDQSLIRRIGQPDGAVRFSMLETIHEFGLEQLATSGDEEAVRQRHADWSLALALGATEDLSSWPTDEQHLHRLEQERANLRAALEWFDQTGQRSAELRLASRLAWLFYLNASLTEGRARLECALRHGDDVDPDIRAAVMYGLAVLAWSQPDHGRVIPLLDEAATIRRDLGDKIGLAHALEMRGIVALDAGDNDYAMELIEEAVALREMAGDSRWVAHGMSHLAYVAYAQGEYERAKALCEQALELLEDMGDTGRRQASVNLSLASIICELGEERQAAILFGQAIGRFRTFGDSFTVVAALAGLARAAAGLDFDDHAIRLLGVVDAFCERNQAVLPWPERLAREHAWEMLRSRLDAATLQAGIADGRSVAFEDAIAFAMETAELLVGMPILPVSVAATATSGLSPHELEVLRPLVDGRSNQE